MASFSAARLAPKPKPSTISPATSRPWDRPETLFYLDPPYWGCETYYGAGLWERGDFERLERALRGLKGRFILSLNDHPEVRRLFAGYQVDSVHTTYSVSATGSKSAGELLITGRS